MNINETSNADLVNIAGSKVVGTESGLKAQEAQAELNKRLIESLDKLQGSIDKNNKATERYNVVAISFSLVMTFLIILQVWLSAVSTDLHWAWKTIFTLAPIVIMFEGFRGLNKK